MLCVIYAYMAIVWTYESTGHASMFLITLLWTHRELPLRSGELEIQQIACLDAHILHNAHSI